MLILVLKQTLVYPSVINFESEGAIPDNYTLKTAWHNGYLMNSTLANL